MRWVWVRVVQPSEAVKVRSNVKLLRHCLLSSLSARVITTLAQPPCVVGVCTAGIALAQSTVILLGSVAQVRGIGVVLGTMVMICWWVVTLPQASLASHI